MKGIGALPDIDDLRCFLAAAEHLNFRRAAELMYLTPAAFGHRIRKLEADLDVRLFERTTRSITLTPAGQRLIGPARDAVRQVLACAESIGGDLQIRVVLATRFELGLSWLVPAVADLAKDRPNLGVDLYFGSGPDILDQLSGGRVDCIVTSAAEARREWQAEFLHDESYVFVGAPALLAEHPFEDVAAAAHHTLLDIDGELPLTRYLTSAVGYLEFAEVQLCGAGMAMRALALAGRGVAVLPEYMVRDDLASGQLVRLLPHASLFSDSFRLIFHKSSPFTANLVRLAEYLRSRPLT